MEKQKKREELLKIISLYREHELLWNTNSFFYRRSDLKKKALEQIGIECNMTEECVKKKLKALRGTYIIEKKKVEQSKKSCSDEANVYVPSLSWYGEMSFLDASISRRKPKDYVSNNTLDESMYVDDAATSKSYESDDISCTPSTSRKRKCEDDINTEIFDKALEKIVNISKPTIDAYSAFADSMAMTLRTMPEETAYLTMKDIQELLYQRKFNKEVVGETSLIEENEPFFEMLVKEELNQ